MGFVDEVNRRTKWIDHPKIPKDTNRVQYIADFFMNPCSAPISLYVETALPALGLALLEYFDFGVMDIWRGFYKPKAASRRGHGARRGRKRKGGGGLPDIGDEIGKLLRPDEFHRRQISDGTRHLWILYGGLERLLWWWMVIDIAGNFFYRWASAMNKTLYCQLTASYWKWGSRDEDTNLWPDRKEAPFGFQSSGSSNGTDIGYNWSIGVPPGYEGFFVWGCASEPHYPDNPPTGLEIAVESNLQTIVSPGTLQPDGKRHHVVALRMRQSGTIGAFHRRSGGGPAKLTGLFMSASLKPIADI